MNAQLDLGRLRGLTKRVVTGLLSLHVVLVAAACLALGTPWGGPTLAATACAAVAVASFRRDDTVARCLAGIALMVSVSILVATFAGHRLQVDLHMYYFAALAMIVGTCDWRAIAAAAAAVAVHHLALNFALPSLVYPGGSDIVRVLLHAVILVLEAATLMWIAYRLERMFGMLDDQAREVEAARTKGEAQERETSRIMLTADEDRRTAEIDVRARERGQVVRSVGDAMAALAGGDLAYVMSDDIPAEYGALRDDYHAATAALREAMLVIAANTQGIRVGGEDMSRAAEDLSVRTEQQAASLEETAAALDEITATVRTTAGGAQEAAGVVGSARADAERSGIVVREAIAAMSAIESSARQIGETVGVIDEIAFQTNLLALNAGVEAARAGDSGRGFAVVAQEVRALAQRSADAAKVIKGLIATSSEHVAAGVGLVGETGRSLERIVGQVNRVADVITAIAASAQEQAQGLDQVNTAVNQMDQVTQQNTAMVERSTAASHALANEAETLVHLVARFRTGTAEEPAARPRRIPARSLAA